MFKSSYLEFFDQVLKLSYCRPDGQGYLVQIDADEVDLATGAVSRDVVAVPLDRIRTFTPPWLLPDLPSPPLRM